ncbi:MAG: hypothetical protein LBQ77_01395 [Treponema sp.]|nr:hypothetical protein [Treponema sp.]
MKNTLFMTFIAVCCSFATLEAQSIIDNNNQMKPAVVPLTRLSLFSSGVGFFEHNGTVNGAISLDVPFAFKAVNDVLKSLTINDPNSRNPMVQYPSEQTVERTLKSLKIDLSGNPSISRLLNDLKGATLDVYAPNQITGRIIGVEERNELNVTGNTTRQSYLSLFTVSGVKVIAIKEIQTFSFKDPQITADLNRALDLLLLSREHDTRTLTVVLPGSGSRNVSLSYVIPVPVWKVSYRLDLSQQLLQGWAIVDNDSDTDWNNVELSLVTGRPVSFIQNLYAPYNTDRPTVPLSIAGIAQAQQYDSGWEGTGFSDAKEVLSSRAVSEEMQMDSPMRASPATGGAFGYAPRPNAITGGTVDTTSGRQAGEQFEFTIKRPVTIARQQSAMVPLVEGTIKAEKSLVFSGTKANDGSTVNPSISAEIINTIGMKLPAGPITVYDGGNYSGDALIEFFPEQVKRIISWGDDLSVTGTVTASNSRAVTSVTVREGIMTVNRRQIYTKEYTFNNNSGTDKRLIIEHPFIGGTTLTEPKTYEERTAQLYRFVRNLPSGVTVYTVTEEVPVYERINLTQLTLNTFISYATNGEIPQHVRNALEKAVALRRNVDNAKTVQATAEAYHNRMLNEQERTRKNLEAAGRDTQQGRDYLNKLAQQDKEIDVAIEDINNAQAAVKAAQTEYDDYISTLDL